MNVHDFTNTINTGHEAYLEELGDEAYLVELRLGKASSSFSDLLCDAAVNLCLAEKNVKLQGKLKYRDQLYKAVENGFKVIKDVLDDLSEEERDDLKSSEVFFKKTFARNSDEGKTDPVSEKSLEEFFEESMTAKKTTVMAPVDEETENPDESKTDPVLETSLAECPKCKESLFKKPKVLPCSHVFCTSCLEGSMRATNKKPGDLMPCEICRRDITIPKEGIGGLDDAEDTETVQKPAQLLPLSSISNTCEACSEDSDVAASNIPPAVIYCVDCEKSFCSECQQHHQKIFKSHEVRYLDDSQNISTKLAQLTITKKAAEVPAKYKHHPVVGQTIVTKAAKEERKRIHGLTILNKELFVITAKSSCVEVYDSKQFSFSHRWSLVLLINPCDIVSCSGNECLYILDSRDKILRVDSSRKVTMIVSTRNKSGESLSVTHDNNIILTLNEERRLCEYSKDGVFIHTVILPLEMLNPLHAIKLIDGDFLVSHGFHRGDLHRVCKVDKDGKLKKSFGRESGKTNQQLDCPSYLAIDESGFVMVADQRNYRVLLLDSDLQFKREIISKQKHNRHYILRILLDESNNHLFVTENWREGRITMFNLHH